MGVGAGAGAGVDMRCQAVKAQRAMPKSSENWSSPWAVEGRRGEGIRSQR